MDLKKIGFWLGIISFFLVLNLPNPEGLSEAGRITGAVFLLMGLWWAFEAIPLQVTALLPLILFPLLGRFRDKHYQQRIYEQSSILFAGGFIIAIAIQKWELHKRVALNILNLVD